MIYNGFDFSLYMVDEDIRESILPETVVDALDVPGADGQLFNSATFGTRVIEIDVRVIRENRRALNELLPFLASKLHSRTPTKLYTRLHPGEYYIAMLTGTIDFEKWFGTGGATVTFATLTMTAPWRSATPRRTCRSWEPTSRGLSSQSTYPQRAATSPSAT